VPIAQAGWVCHINFDNASDITLTVYKGDMHGIGGGHTRPKITFSFDEGSGRMRLRHSSPNHGGQGESRDVKDADAKWVQTQARRRRASTLYWGRPSAAETFNMFWRSLGFEHGAHGEA
jgi:hypothetical protein